MNSISKAKEWIKTNFPMLSSLYENKYVGMLYDRFISLPSEQQRRVIIGGIGSVIVLVFSIVLSTYIGYSSSIGKADKSQNMINMLLQYQKTRRSQDQQIMVLDRNRSLTNPGALKNAIVEEAKAANISPRMIKVDQHTEPGKPHDDSKGSDLKVQEATVRIERVNLSQVKGFLQNIEKGTYNLNLTYLKIVNDEQLRGYMNVDANVSAYLFDKAEGQ